jgi:DNA-binding response OmpR family regulator
LSNAGSSPRPTERADLFQQRFLERTTPSKHLFDAPDVCQDADGFFGGNVLRYADLQLDEIHRTCFRRGVDLGLTTKEFDLLLALFRQAQTVSLGTLAEEVWGGKDRADANAIRVVVQRLRSKLDAPFDLKLLNTVRSRGYVMGDSPNSWSSVRRPD